MADRRQGALKRLDPEASAKLEAMLRRAVDLGAPAANLRGLREMAAAKRRAAGV